MRNWPKRYSIVLALGLLLGMLPVSSLQAQSYAVVVKGGYSDYGEACIGGIGGGGCEWNWERGPILGIGIRRRTSESFAVEAVLDYSWHRYRGGEWEMNLVNEPWNRILELNAIARYSIALYRPVYFNLLGGMGLSYQDKDDLVREYDGQVYTTAGVESFHVSGVLGFALEGRVADRIELSLEGTWHMRYYISPTVQLGIAYVIDPD
ncbi:hypothetical protein KQI65_10155 [bacterium]|nr:hypothetical protein [bacterium]